MNDPAWADHSDGDKSSHQKIYTSEEDAYQIIGGAIQIIVYTSIVLFIIVLVTMITVGTAQAAKNCNSKYRYSGIIVVIIVIIVVFWLANKLVKNTNKST